MLVHPNRNIEKKFIYSITLTVIILLLEVAGGLWTGSLALLSDAAHVLMDIFALALSFIAMRLAALPVTDKHTYGYHRLEVLAALINGVTLFIIAGGIFYEAWERWQSPTEVRGTEMLVIAFIGLVANVIVIFFLHEGHSHAGHSHDEHSHAAHNHEHHDHESHAHDDHHPEKGFQPQDVNIQSAYFLVIGDAVSSVGVIIAAVVISLTGWLWVDPLASVLIGALILLSSVRVLKTSLNILIEGVPEGISLPKIRQALLEIKGLDQVHDLHVWNLCSNHIALSAHVVVDSGSPLSHDELISKINQELDAHFGIQHTTIQVEHQLCGVQD